jgi:hypothetical protein
MRRILVLSALVLLVGTGCATSRPQSSPEAGPASTGPSTAPPVATTSAARPPASPAASSDYRVTYDWAVPSRRVTVKNPVALPITPPPGIPLPYLVEIRTGDHPDFARITFGFRGAFPEYNFNYAPNVEQEGRGTPVTLPGNAFLRIQFVNAQTHDNAGASTIVSAANQSVGIGNLVGYSPAGDFEGYVTYGLGIRTAPNSDQVLKIRVGQLRRPDGLYVIAFDVRKG